MKNRGLVAFTAILGTSFMAGLLVWRGIIPSPIHTLELVGTTLEATFNPARQKNLDEVSVIAAKIEAESGFPAEAMVAQWAIESDWGQKPVCQYNYFGIKLAARHQAGCSHETTEIWSARRIAIWNEQHPGHDIGAGAAVPPEGYYVRVSQQFADYHSIEDACRDYASLITTGIPYAPAWRAYQQSKDVRVLLQGLAGIYWTDPGYVNKAIAIIDELDVKESLQIVRNHSVPSPPWSPTRGLPPTAVAALSVGLGNVVIGLIGYAWRQRSKAHRAELEEKLRSIAAGLRVQLAEAESRLQDRNRNDTRDLLKDNNSDLMNRMNGRYLQTEKFQKEQAEQTAKFQEAHQESLRHIEELVKGVKGLQVPTVRLGG